MKKLFTLVITALFAVSSYADDPTLIKLFTKSGNTYTLPTSAAGFESYVTDATSNLYSFPKETPLNEDQTDIIIDGLNSVRVYFKSPVYINSGSTTGNNTITESLQPTDQDIANWTTNDWQTVIRVKPNKGGTLAFKASAHTTSNRSIGIYQVATQEEKDNGGTGKWLDIQAFKDDNSTTYHTSSADVNSEHEYLLVCAGTTNFYFTEISFTPASYTLTTADNDYYSLYLDYNADIPTGIEAYTGKLSSNGAYLSLTKIDDGVIPANNGVLVKSPSSTGSFTFNATASAATATSDLKGVTTETTASAIEAEETGKTVLTLGTKGGTIGFRKPAGGTIGANKAYLLVDTPSSSAAPDFVIGIDDENTTGINGITADEADVDAPMYNIAGQRVNGNAKGLVIKNGKKYMLK